MSYVHAAVGGEMPARGREERVALHRVGLVDEVARQHDVVEGRRQAQRSQFREDRVHPRVQTGEHVRGIVHAGHVETPGGQRVGEPSDSTAEVEHASRWRQPAQQRRELRFGGQVEIDLDG
ncbi:hypothetical protein GCM10023223_24700 [Stackebrandtia albiflava]